LRKVTTGGNNMCPLGKPEGSHVCGCPCGSVAQLLLTYCCMCSYILTEFFIGCKPNPPVPPTNPPHHWSITNPTSRRITIGKDPAFQYFTPPSARRVHKQAQSYIQPRLPINLREIKQSTRRVIFKDRSGKKRTHPLKMSSLDVEALLEAPFKAATPSKHHDRPSSSGAADGDVRNGKDGRDRSDRHRDDRDRGLDRDDGRSTSRSHDSRRRSRDSERYVTSPTLNFAIY